MKTPDGWEESFQKDRNAFTRWKCLGDGALVETVTSTMETVQDETGQPRKAIVVKMTRSIMIYKR